MYTSFYKLFEESMSDVLLLMTALAAVSQKYLTSQVIKANEIGTPASASSG